MTTQPRYRIIYSTTARPFYMMWDQVPNLTNAIAIHAALTQLPGVTFAYIYDGQTKTRFNISGTDPNQ